MAAAGGLIAKGKEKEFIQAADKVIEEQLRNEVRKIKWEDNGMAGKIFYRERGKIGKGEKKPRFRLVASLAWI
jgi:hypothetical protein